MTKKKKVTRSDKSGAALSESKKTDLVWKVIGAMMYPPKNALGRRESE